MKLRFRVWMPLAAVFVVLLSVVSLLAYAIPTVKARLEEHNRGYALSRAASIADSVAGASGEELRRSLSAAADSVDGEVLAVDPSGEIRAEAGTELLAPGSPALEEVEGEQRQILRSRELLVAQAPVIHEGEMTGSVVVIYEDPASSVYWLFLRSGLEAAVISSVIGGALMLLLGTSLSRRVARLERGARRLEAGDLSTRIEPKSDDELGGLARTLNAMAESLQSSFSRLEENDETLSAVLDNLNEGVLATDLDGRVVFINPVARSMLGLGEGETPSRLPEAWEDFDLPGAVARCAREEECGEARVRSGDTFLRVNVEHMPAFDNHRGGVLVVLQDLSEGRRLEASQQRFLANAAHELRTPLATISFAAELLSADAGDDPQARRRFLEHIRSAADRMQRLSESLLRLARVGWDTTEPEIQRVSPGECARAAAEQMRPLAESAGLSLHVEDEGTPVLADPALLEQALLVAISNAIKHSEPGGGITLRAEGPKITVEDTGEGINPADLPYVFERFRKGGETGGFGMGLSICRESVRRMGGEVEVRSEPGKGSVVSIMLPEEESGA